jgi:DNA-directed RNA polymerase subunit RPC12/RpoP
MDYYEYEKSKQTCSHCNWDGLGRETPILESFAELAERACPRCGEKIAVVMYPTLPESRANWQDLEPAERNYVEAIEASQKDFTARSLKTASQLPEIPVPAFALFWDDDGKDGEGGDTVIRLGDLVVWQEPCVYEGYWRFDESRQYFGRSTDPRCRISSRPAEPSFICMETSGVHRIR